MLNSAHEKNPRSEAGNVESVRRALEILEALSRSEDEMGVSEIRAATGLPLSTLHRMLTSLSYYGFARQNSDTRKYGLGLRLMAMASTIHGHVEPLAQPFLKELVRVSKETANLAIRNQDSTIYSAAGTRSTSTVHSYQAGHSNTFARYQQWKSSSRPRTAARGEVATPSYRVAGDGPEYDH